MGGNSLPCWLQDAYKAPAAPAIPVQASSIPSQAPSADAPPGPLTGPTTKLRAYPHKFHEVIEHAKVISQCECASSDPFPSRADFLNRKSGEHFCEAIAETEHVPEGYWPRYRKELGILLWEALMTWCSTLKAKAREIIPCFYALSEDHTMEENKAKAEF
ncbi:hypothetical protein OG21DRAFT_1490800 [Imleria badia]|nr:hypothetical protein OG21DRAFT_1490800 [Imleria badia]